MTRSMTAFARAQHGAAIWEIRSVNHRYLDVNFRLQDNFKYLETELRTQFKKVLYRGKIECTLKIKSEEVTSSLDINEPLALELKNAMEKVTSLTGLTNKGDALSFMRWPDVLSSPDVGEALADDVLVAFKKAVEQLAKMRSREGHELAELIEVKLKEIEETIQEIRLTAADIATNLHDRLKAKLAELDIVVEPARLEQEFVLQAQKLDIIEELDRINTHVTEVRRCLDSTEPVGRRLDFLMQELNREANTLSSKAQSTDTTLSAVDLKVLIEQIREQVQNIE